MKRIFLFSFASLALLFQSQGHAAKESQIEVTLFGQPCHLQGPLDPTTLQLIHAISPEQIAPSLSNSEAQTALGILKDANKKIPASLEEYRGELQKRVEAILAYDKGAIQAARTKTVAPLIEAAKPHLKPKPFAKFEALAKKTAQKQKGAVTTNEVMRLREDFENLLPNHPEEEFHRQIRKLKVNYNCTFEETETDEEVSE